MVQQHQQQENQAETESQQNIFGGEQPAMLATEKQPQASAIGGGGGMQPMNINTNVPSSTSARTSGAGLPVGTLASSAAGQTNTIKVGFYEVDRTIGKGNYAVVKLARHRITKTEVAIKIVDKRRLDANNLAKIYREIDVLKKLRHPHIVRLYQVMETSNMLYLVTEYAPNGEIFDLISKQHRLSEENAREKFWQIISAVDYLHNMNIVHRDLKAENLLLDANNQIKLADFGFSNFFSYHDTLNTFCGSPPYAAPEVFEGKRYAGPEIDIWSLGVILYVMVCGALPFEGVNLQLLRDRVLSGRIRIPYFMSSDCEHLVRKMLTVDPRRRPSIEQIKQHRWMRYGQFAHKYGQQQQPQATANVSEQSPTSQTSPAEPHPQILRLMNNIGIESHKVLSALQADAYDNFQAIYLLLLERLQQRGSPSLSPSQSSSAANSANSPTIATMAAANSAVTASSLLTNAPPASPPIVVQPACPSELSSPTTNKAPALVLTASPLATASPSNATAATSEAIRLIRSSIKARRQSDGVAVIGGGLVPCQCCCCTAALQQPIGRRLTAAQMPGNAAGILSRHAALALAQQVQQGAEADQQQQQQQQQHEVQAAQGVHQQHLPSTTSDYESEGGYCCSGSSAAGSSSLSRQSTIGTINSFDEGCIPDDSAMSMAAGGSGLLMFAAAASGNHQFFHAGSGFHEQLPAFDSQLSQDPLFSSQSSNNSAAAFRMGSTSSNGPTGGGVGNEEVPSSSCCCSASSTGVSGGGTGGNLLRQVQLHPHCGGIGGPGSSTLQHHNHHHNIGGGGGQNRFHCHYYHHQHHPQLLKPYWFPAPIRQSPAAAHQQIHSARATFGGENGAENAGEHGHGESQQQNDASAFCDQQQQWRASDNAISDNSLNFPTGQLGKRNRAMPELHRPSPSTAGQPLLHNQFRRMRISTGLATLAQAIPLAVGVTASPILSCGMGSPQSPTGPPLPSAASSSSTVRQVLGCLPKRISLPENLEFQPQMLLNLKQSIHVEKQLTSNPDAAADPSASELTGFEKPMLKTSRFQQYQQQQQQKRKAARLQLLRQQSYHMAQKASMISASLPMNMNNNNNNCGSPTALNFHQKQMLHLQTTASAMAQKSDDSVMDEASETSDQQRRIPLSPIEDLKAEEVMDTS